MTAEAQPHAADMPDSQDAERLARYVAALLEENAHVNLTGAKTADALRRVHVADSLALVPHLRPLSPARCIDLGSGGGLPGMVLACALPETRWTLVDATRKKVDALNRMAAAVGLDNVAAIWGRAEQIARDPAHCGLYDVLTARAVTVLPQLIAYAAPFLRVGGTAWFYKTTEALRCEFSKAGAAARAAGMNWEATYEYTLEGEAPGRAIVCYRRV